MRRIIVKKILTARRAAEIEPFEVMDVLSRAQALERAGRRVVHMEIGEPDFTAPEPVVEAGIRAMREGRTAYTATLGVHALREAIATHYERRFGATVAPERIAITSGASGGLLTVAAERQHREEVCADRGHRQGRIIRARGRRNGGFFPGLCLPGRGRSAMEAPPGKAKGLESPRTPRSPS